MTSTNIPSQIQVEQVCVDLIEVPRGRRIPDQESVAALASSIKVIGLRTPITVRCFADRKSADGTTDDSYVLVAGAHRLAAVKSLGWEKIDCIEISDEDIDAELWEIAENLHRAELTALERSNQIKRWADLTAAKVLQVETPSGGHQPREKGVRKVARDLGTSTADVHRAVKIASISEEAKQAARDVGLDNNRRALLEVAKETTPEAQVAKVAALKNKTEPPPKVAAPDLPASPNSKPTDSNVDSAGAASLATGMRTALSGIDPVLDRIEEIGPSGFWKTIRSNPSEIDLRRMFQDTARRLRAIADDYGGSVDNTPPTAVNPSAQPTSTTAEPVQHEDLDIPPDLDRRHEAPPRTLEA
jgi:ParB family chromosome partitioning protein